MSNDSPEIQIGPPFEMARQKCLFRWSG